MAMGTEIAAGKNILDLAAGRNALIRPGAANSGTGFPAKEEWGS